MRFDAFEKLSLTDLDLSIFIVYLVQRDRKLTGRRRRHLASKTTDHASFGVCGKGRQVKLLGLCLKLTQVFSGFAIWADPCGKVKVFELRCVASHIGEWIVLSARRFRCLFSVWFVVFGAVFVCLGVWFSVYSIHFAALYSFYLALPQPDVG